MSDNFLDHLPSHERQKLKKMMSPEAYEKLRERVKGPEDLAKEMRQSERLAEARFEMATRTEAHEQLRSHIERDRKEQGSESVFEMQDASPDAKKALEQGKYTVAVSSHPTTHQDALVAIPEGNVAEKIPVKTTMSDKYVSGLLSSKK